MPDDLDAKLRELSIPIPELSDKPPVAEAIADVPQEAAPDFGTPRRRSSRKRKPAPQPQVEPAPAPEPTQPVLGDVEKQQIATAIGVGFRVIFAIIASKRGQHWQLAPADESLLAVTWTDAAAPWIAANAKYVPLAVATLATVGVIMPRMDMDARLHPKVEGPTRNPDVPPPATSPNDNAAPTG